MKNEVMVIAELGWNFMGDMALAEQMIESAKKAGANVVKFQYWDPAKLKPGVWDTDGRREIYEAAKLNATSIKQLIEFSEACGIDCLFSVFNKEDAAFVKSLGVNKIKIPSHEVANFELHKYCLEKFDFVIASIGACSEEELAAVAEIYSSAAEGSYSVLHCISAYPCPLEKMNLPRLQLLKKYFGGTVGLSDHSTSTLTGGFAFGYGARVFEKHFTSNKELAGRDNKFALVESELVEYIEIITGASNAGMFHGAGALDIEQDTINQYRGRWG